MTTTLCGSTYVMLFTTMVVTLLVILIVSITPVMFTTVPLGSGMGVGVSVGVGVLVGVCVNTSTVILWASNAPAAALTPWTCAVAPRVGLPLIVVCESRTTRVLATTHPSWAICSIAPSMVNGTGCGDGADASVVAAGNAGIGLSCGAPCAVRPQALRSST